MRATRLQWLGFAMVLGGVMFSSPAEGQDAHYWTDQLGNRAQLLAGAVIGSDEDLSAVFYNPGRIGRGVQPELILTGNIFELEKLTVEEGEPPNRKADQLRFRGVPSLFAGEIYGKWLGRNRLAYSFFTRFDSSFRSTARFGETFAPGDFEFEFFEDEVQLDSSLSEHWAGLTWARPVGPRQGVGVSTFVAVRNDRTRITNVRQAIFDSGDLGIAYKNQDLDFYDWRVLWKAGYSTEFSDWRLGVTLTTPSLQLFGSGSLNFDDSLVTTTDPTLIDDRIISTSQKDLSAEYKSPLSFGFGASRDFGSHSIHFAIEWFDSVAPYTVVEAEPFENQETGELIDPDIVHSLDSVTNFAIGYEKRFNNGTRAFGGFRSDFSAAPDRGESDLAVSDWDLWHIAGGVSFAIGKSSMTLGTVYAFGSSEASPVLVDQEDPIKLGFSRLTFILGFDFATKSHDRGDVTTKD